MTRCPKISAIIRTDQGGLGTLSRACHEYLGFHRTLAINRIPGERGAFCAENTDANRRAGDSIAVADIHWLCQGADVLLSFETFYSRDVPRLAKQIGVRVALCMMYECTPMEAEWFDCVDVVLCPTGLDLMEAEQTSGLAGARKLLLPIPCDTARIGFIARNRAEVFVHRAGHQGDSGRNGTQEVLSAWALLKSPAKLLLYHQNSLAWPVPSNANIQCRRVNFANYWDMWDGTGDVLLHPTRHDALSLPIQEALTSGLPVIAADWWPHCDDGERKGYLPPWSQANAVPVARTGPQRMCREFTAHYVTAPAIAEIVDRLYSEDISAASLEARRWAEDRSWANLRAQWLEALSA